MPIGYGDGVRRALTNNCDVLIGGRRYPLVGTVSMDNITVDLGPASPGWRVGDDGDADRPRRAPSARPPRSSPTRLGTINYEILAGISRAGAARSTTATGVPA